MIILNFKYFLLNKFIGNCYFELGMGFNTNTVLQSYTDYIENDETNLLDKLAARKWLVTTA